ncbi:MAG: VOC family protein [Alphaproteobacteria bacterium]|nr:VOC family protein [Alphaproteobacteria bacterium]
MSLVKIKDIAHVRFTAPDLDAMEAFLGEFGLTRTERRDDTLFMRGTGASPFLHATTRGAAGFAAIGFAADSVDDLGILAKAEDAAIEALDAPGGGSVVRLRDPDGFLVEVTAGQQPVAPRALPAREATNDGRGHPRENELKRVAPGPAHVLRLGHAVLNVTDFRRSEAWYKRLFGFVTSDEITLDGVPNPIGAFLRCDRGDQPTDHHTLFLVGAGTPKFNHAAFEVADFDDLMVGHEHLKAHGRQHEWGIGRHILGSQIFDYWRDPWGHAVEHWTDGDRLDAAWGSRISPLKDLTGTQWGPEAPRTMG